MPYLTEAQADEIASFHCVSLQWLVTHGDLNLAKARGLINDKLRDLRAARDGRTVRGIPFEDPEYAELPLAERYEVLARLRAYEDAVAHLDAITTLVNSRDLALERAIELLMNTRRELHWIAQDGPVWPVANRRVFRARRSPEDARPTAFERVMRDDGDEDDA